MAEKLFFNTANAVTGRLERCHLQGQPAVRKVLNGRNTPQTPSSWRASTQPGHWNYWRREYCVYTSDLAEWVAPAQIHLPALLRAEPNYQQQSHQIELVLEDLGDCGGLKIKHSHYPEILRRWARAQALLSQQLQRAQASWLSQSFLADYIESKQAPYALLDADEAWTHPVVERAWPEVLRERLLQFAGRRQAVLAQAARAPKIPNHLDFWPNNLFWHEPSSRVYLIDWNFFGWGMPGEDLANFIPDAVFDGFVGADQLDSMRSHLLPAYHQGLVEGGYDISADELQHYVGLAAIKYVWLAPVLLKRAIEGQFSAYGNVDLATAQQQEDQYRERGVCLLYLCDWLDEVLA